MKKNPTVATLSAMLMFSLLFSPAQALANGSGNIPEKTRLRIVPEPNVTKPIGTIESIGKIKINGQFLPGGKGPFWGGELIQLPAGINAQVRIGSLGQVSLDGGAEVKISVRKHQAEIHSQQTLLVDLTSGSVTIKLEAGIPAYLSARGTLFAASAGSRLRFGVREERAFADALSGSVMDAGNWAATPPPPVMMAAANAVRRNAQAAQRRYLITPVQAMYDVKARSTRQVQVRVTDENNNDVPNLPIIFSLSGNVGALSATSAVTNSAGVASVNFTAGSQATQGAITATVQGTQFATTMQIAVLKFVPGFFSPQNAIPIFSSVGVATAIGVTEIITKEDPLKIKAAGGPITRP
jgi:hypothetical protein